MADNRLGYLGIPSEYHPVFGIQNSLNGYRHLTDEVDNPYPYGGNPLDDDNAFGIGIDIDTTPRWVAGYALGAIALLAALKFAGFRFVVGVGR